MGDDLTEDVEKLTELPKFVRLLAEHTVLRTPTCGTINCHATSSSFVRCQHEIVRDVPEGTLEAIFFRAWAASHTEWWPRHDVVRIKTAFNDQTTGYVPVQRLDVAGTLGPTRKPNPST